MNSQENSGNHTGAYRDEKQRSHHSRRLILPRANLEIRNPSPRITVWQTWNRLPVSTKLYSIILAFLLLLLLVLILVRSNSQPWGLLAKIQGLNESQTTPAVETIRESDSLQNKPVAVAKVNADLYSGPATSYPVIGLLENGNIAELVGVSSEGTWFIVLVPDGSGSKAWVASAQVETQNSEGVPVVPATDNLLDATKSTANPAVATAIMNVNIRSGPGLEYQKIGLLAEDQEAEIVGQDAEQYWYLIKVPGEENLQGWISKDYVNVKNVDSLPAVEAQNMITMLIPLTVVNIRAGPGKDYAIIGSLESGQAAEVVGVSPDGEWWAIKFNAGLNGQGWVSAKFVKVENAEKVPVIKQ